MKVLGRLYVRRSRISDFIPRFRISPKDGWRASVIFFPTPVNELADAIARRTSDDTLGTVEDAVRRAISQWVDDRETLLKVRKADLERAQSQSDLGTPLDAVGGNGEPSDQRPGVLDPVEIGPELLPKRAVDGTVSGNGQVGIAGHDVSSVDGGPSVEPDVAS